MSNEKSYPSAAEMIKKIYGPVIIDELKKARRMSLIFLLTDGRATADALVVMSKKRFMRKETRQILKHAADVLNAYDEIYPRSHTFTIRNGGDE